MAGLPYYFFPTDYLYPQAPPSITDAASKAALVGPVQSLKVDRIDGSVNPKAALGGARSSSASSALVLSESAIQKEVRRGTPIVSDPRKSDDADA